MLAVQQGIDRARLCTHAILSCFTMSQRWGREGGSNSNGQRGSQPPAQQAHCCRHNSRVQSRVEKGKTAPQACRCSAGQRLTQSAFQMVSMRWPSVHCKVPARGTQGSGARCLSPKPNARAAACRAVQLMHVHHSWSQLDRPFASARCAPVWKLSIVSEVTGQEDEGGNGGRGGGGGAFAAQLSGRVEGMGMIPVSSRKKRGSGADRHCNSPGSMALCAQLQLQRQRHAHRGSGFWLRPKHMCLSRTRRTACRQGQLASELAAANCNPVTVATVHALTCRRTAGSGQPQPRGTCGTASAGEGR